MRRTNLTQAVIVVSLLMKLSRLVITSKSDFFKGAGIAEGYKL